MIRDDDAPLLDAWRDGDATPAQAEALRSRLEDPTFASAAVDELRLQATIGALLRADDAELLRRVEAILAAQRASGQQRLLGAVERRVEARPSRRPSARIRVRRPTRMAFAPLLAAAALALALVGWLAWPRHAAPAPSAPIARTPVPTPVAVDARVVARLAEHGPGAAVARGGTALVIARGDPLHADDAVTGPATVAFADGTTATLAAGAQATFALSGGAKRVRLERGELAASVAPQPTGRPLRIAAPHADVVVRGTAFTVEAGAALTRVSVTRGAVALERPDAEPLEVRAGESAWADAAGTAREPDATTLAAAVRASPTEEAFLDVPWRLDLLAARAEAARAGRPLLLWAGWGHPLGMASADPLSDRRGVFADRATLDLLRDRCVPVAIDTWTHTRRTDAAGAWFAALAAAAQRKDTTHDGLYLVGSDGILIAFIPPGEQPERLRAALVALPAMRAVEPPAAAGAEDATLAWRAPAGAWAGVVHARRLLPDGQGWRGDGPVARHHLWLTVAEQRALLAVADGGTVDARVATKIARHAFLDATLTEASAWDPESIREVVLVARRDGRDSHDGDALRLLGRARIAGRGGSLSVELAGRLEGTDGRLRTLRLIGLCRGEGALTRALGVVLEPAAAAIDQAVPPHGMRDSSYLRLAGDP